MRKYYWVFISFIFSVPHQWKHFRWGRKQDNGIKYPKKKYTLRLVIGRETWAGQYTETYNLYQGFFSFLHNATNLALKRNRYDLRVNNKTKSRNVGSWDREISTNFWPVLSYLVWGSRGESQAYLKTTKTKREMKDKIRKGGSVVNLAEC